MSNVIFKNIQKFPAETLENFEDIDSFKTFTQDMCDLVSSTQWALSYTTPENANKYLGFSLFKGKTLLVRYNIKKDQFDNRSDVVTSKFREITRKHQQTLHNLFEYIHNS